MFMNEYNHTIDAKGRMILPAKFREGLGNRFVLSRGIDQCLTIYPLENWEKLASSLQKHLREYAGIKKEALVIGTGATIEIWSPEILQLTNSKEESIGELAESLDVPMDFEI